MADFGAAGGFSSGLTAGIGTMHNMQQLRMQREQMQRQAEQQQRENDLREQTLEITRQQLGQKGLEEEARKYEANLKMLTDAIDNAPDSGRAAAILQSLEKSGALKGFDDAAAVVQSPASAKDLLMSRVMAKRSEEEQLAMKGAEATVTAEAGAKATAKYREARAPDMRNYITPTGQKGIINADDATAIARLPAGSQLFSVVAQPATMGDLAQPGPKEGPEARQTIGETTGNVAQGAEVLKKLKDTPFGAGARGTIAEYGAGILQQVPGLQGAAEQFSETVAGGSVAEVTKLRTDLRMRVAGMLRAISGDQTDRYTNQDRERAESALRAMEVSAGPEQIVAATKSAMEMDIISRERAKAKLGASAYTDRARLEGEAQKLVQMGFSEDEAADIAVRVHKEMLDLQDQLKPPANAPK